MRSLCAVAAALLLASVMWAQNTSNNTSTNNTELQNATNVIQQMTSNGSDNSVPKSVLESAKCVAVVPNLIKGAFIVGGEHGTGVATCRTSNGWSAPAPFSVSGVSWGPQIGGQSTNVVMFVMNQQGMNSLLSGHFKVGGSVSAAAGPVGRQAAASAGWKAGILTYSRSKGAFVGASLNGAELQQDNKATKQWYGRNVSIQQILSGKVQPPNQEARSFVHAVENAKQVAQSQ